MPQKLKILDDEDVSPIVGTVYQLLVEKTMFEMRKHDANNRLILGGVGFFFKEDHDQYLLCYDKHPKTWNETLIKNDVEEIRKYILKSKGAYIEE